MQQKKQSGTEAERILDMGRSFVVGTTRADRRSEFFGYDMTYSSIWL